MITSLYISDTKIKVVVGNRLKNGFFSIEKIYWQNVSAGAIIGGVITDSSLLKNDIYALCTANNLKLKNIDLIIDSSNILIRQTSAPANISGKDLLTIVKNEYIDFNADKYSFGFTEIKKNNDGTSRFLGFSVPCDFIKSYTDMFKSLGISVLCVNSSVNALIQLSGFMSGLSNKTYILTVLTGSVIVCALFVNGKYHFSNRSRLVNERESPELENEIEGFISSFIQYNKSEKNGADVTDVYFCGLHHSEYNTMKRIKNTLGISAQILPDTPEFAGNSKIPFVLADYVYNAGGLVRQSGVNFYPSYTRLNKNSKTFKVLNNIYPSVIAVILVLFLNMAASNKLNQISLEYNSNNVDTERIYLEYAVPVFKNEYEILNTLLNEYDTYRHISENISGLKDYCDNMEILSADYNSSENILSISCECSDVSLISGFADKLSSSGYFEKVNYDGYQYAEGSYKYTLKCKFYEIQSGGS